MTDKWRTAEAHLMAELLRHINEMEQAESRLMRIEATIRDQVLHDMEGRDSMGSRPDDLFRKAYHADEDWKIALDNIRHHERRATMYGPAALAVQNRMRGLVAERERRLPFDRLGPGPHIGPNEG